MIILELDTKPTSPTLSEKETHLLKRVPAAKGYGFEFPGG